MGSSVLRRVRNAGAALGGCGLMIGFAALPLRGLLLAVVSDPKVLILVQALDGVSAAALGVLLLAALVAVVFLVAGDSVSEGAATLLGLAALVLWWVVALAGLLILTRWLPTRGRHAADATEDSWSSGPGLSVLGHVGMVVGVAVFTYAYLSKVV